MHVLCTRFNMCLTNSFVPKLNAYWTVYKTAKNSENLIVAGARRSKIDTQKVLTGSKWLNSFFFFFSDALEGWVVVLKNYQKKM